MSRVLPFALLVTLAACGGSDSPGPVDPPDTSPASLEISAGDQQMADGGAAVAVPPAVRVEDSDGQPVAGVSVQFTVDAGGGTVTGAPAVTNSSGIASVTTWTLGPSGDQRLTARVGTLTPVTFEASITPGTELVIVEVGPDGGTHDLPPGHPFEGFGIEIPTLTYDETVEWRFRATDAPELDLPSGLSIQGGALEITTEAGRGADLMTLRVPASRDEDQSVVIALYDPEREIMEILPTVGRTETHVEVMTAHLNAGLLMGPGAELSAAMGEPARQINLGGSTGQLLRLALDLPVAALASSVDPWPVLEHGSSAFPDGHGVAIPALQALGGHYFGFPQFADIVRKLSTPGFYAEAGPLAAVQIAHSRLTEPLQAILQRIAGRMAQLPKAERDAIVHQDVAAAMAIAGRPSLVGFSSTETMSGHTLFGLVAGAAEQSVSALVPALQALVEMHLEGTEGWETGQIPTTGDGTPQAVDGLLHLPSFLVPLEAIGDIVEKLARLGSATSEEARAAINAELAAEAGLPDPELEFKDLDGDTWAPVDEDVVVWSPQTTIRIDGGRFASFTLHLPFGDLVAQSASDGSLALGTLDAIANLQPLSRVFHVLSLQEMVAGVVRQIVPLRRPMMRATFEATPDQVMVESPGDPVDLEAEFSTLLLSGFRIEWDWGDGEVTDNLGLVNASHSYEETGVYPVVVSLKPASLPLTLAKDTVHVTVGESGVWHGVDHYREFARVDPTPPDLLALRNFLLAMDPTDLFFIARPDGGGMEDIFMLLLTPGTGATLQQPPTNAGFGGIEMLVHRAPEGTLADGNSSIAGTGSFGTGPTTMNYQISASFADGSMEGSFTAQSQAKEPDFGNSYFSVFIWDFSAKRFTPPEDDDDDGGEGP